jgi:hypothetical protein
LRLDLVLPGVIDGLRFLGLSDLSDVDIQDLLVLAVELLEFFDFGGDGARFLLSVNEFVRFVRFRRRVSG